uniref:Uncharacterized protein n=1 Tax=Aegilops tauschii subsp. strangulata TaxID=200361 RepID=A0A453GD46_AEGTS
MIKIQELYNYILPYLWSSQGVQDSSHQSTTWMPMVNLLPPQPLPPAPHRSTLRVQLLHRRQCLLGNWFGHRTI